MTATTKGERGIDADRLMSSLIGLARIGADPLGGITRPAFSPAYFEAANWLLEAMRSAGLNARMDPAGNVIGRAGPAGVPALLVGSHIDTVPNGGAYDGALGVLAGLECARVLLPRLAASPIALEVVAFADEEGAYISLFGSRAMTGMLNADLLVGDKGKIVRDLMSRSGLDLDRVGEAHRPALDFAGYLELHIEQDLSWRRPALTSVSSML